MPAHRTFDYEYLKELVRKHPGWGYREYARALTEHARQAGQSVRPIKPNTVAVALARYRDTWAEEGIQLAYAPRPTRVLPWTGIPEGWRMEYPLRMLRQYLNMMNGENLGQPQTRYTQRWAGKMHERKRVVDLTPGGRPVVRAARPDELDGEGNLIHLYSKHPGLTETEWQSMTPGERAAASAKWMATPLQRDTPADLRKLASGLTRMVR